MRTEFAIGGKNDGEMKPIKTFPEQYEINVRQMVSKNLLKEQRADGEEVFVVDDLDQLILDIMVYYEDSSNRGYPRKR